MGRERWLWLSGRRSFLWHTRPATGFRPRLGWALIVRRPPRGCIRTGGSFGRRLGSSWSPPAISGPTVRTRHLGATAGSCRWPAQETRAAELNGRVRSEGCVRAPAETTRSARADQPLPGQATTATTLAEFTVSTRVGNGAAAPVGGGFGLLPGGRALPLDQHGADFVLRDGKFVEAVEQGLVSVAGAAADPTPPTVCSSGTGRRVPLLIFGGPAGNVIDSRWNGHPSIGKTVLDLLGLPPLGVPGLDDAPSLADLIDPIATPAAAHIRPGPAPSCSARHRPSPTQRPTNPHIAPAARRSATSSIRGVRRARR